MCWGIVYADVSVSLSLLLAPLQLDQCVAANSLFAAYFFWNVVACSTEQAEHLPRSEPVVS